MLQACIKQEEFFYTFNLDMYKDAYSLPSLSENIMCQFSLIEFESFITNTIPTPNDNIFLKYIQQQELKNIKLKI